MPFIHVARSLDDLLYEIMTWLIFYPVTLWRSVRHPLRTMEYARGELGKEPGTQFRETLRPPIFLLVTVMLAYVVELAAVGESAVVTSDSGVANLIDDDQSVMIFRIVGLALFPVVLAAIEAGLGRQPVNRHTLQEPFYAQCFLAAPLVLALCLATTGVRRPEQWLEPASLAAAVLATLLYICAEAAWLVRSTKSTWSRALPAAIGGTLGCLVVLGAVVWLLGAD
jgi:hypothetical protein